MRFWRRRRSRTLGERGEDLAAKHLKRSGYTILARNVWLGRHEIDIIAREGDTIAFVEVRTRTADDPVPPEDSIGRTKRQHVRAAAHRYIARYGAEGSYYRFDVVGVTLPEGGKPQIVLHRDAFQDDKT